MECMDERAVGEERVEDKLSGNLTVDIEKCRFCLPIPFEKCNITPTILLLTPYLTCLNALPSISVISLAIMLSSEWKAAAKSPAVACRKTPITAAVSGA